MDITSRRTPIQAPRANSIAERWVRTVRRECLDHLIPLNERHLLTILAEFVDYYNHDRLHRSLSLQAPLPKPQARHGGITVRAVLGGLHHVYERAASTGLTSATLQVSQIQLHALKTLRAGVADERERKHLERVLLVAVNGVAVGVQNTG